MKPMIFNTEMTRAILDGRKTVTRRVIKPQPVMYGFLETHFDWSKVKLPYRPGDILYVRETWNYGYCDTTDFECRCNETFFEELEPGSMKGSFLFPRYFYRTEDLDGIVGMKWRPSIHMPREAARIFLRVTDIKVQRVQDITDEEAQKEGVKGWMVATDRDWDKNPNFVIAFRHVWNNCYSKPQSVKTKGVITHYESYPWEDIQETRTYRGKPWYVIGNPWVWIIEFERCEKPEGG